MQPLYEDPYGILSLCGQLDAPVQLLRFPKKIEAKSILRWMLLKKLAYSKKPLQVLSSLHI